METWKDIPGYEGCYQVSNTGLVKSLERRVPHGYSGTQFFRERILTSNTRKDGYQYVFLSKNCVQTRFYIHRLVGMMFIPNPNNYPSINHKDGNPSNNVVENLEWCTQGYNIHHAIKVLGKYGFHSPVRCVETGVEYPRMSLAAEAVNRTSSCISYAARLGKTSAGYHWEYINKPHKRNNHGK